MAKGMDLSKLSDEQILQIAKLYKDELGFGAQIVEPLSSIISPTPVTNEEELQVLNSETACKVFLSFVEELKKLDVVDKDNLKQAFKNVQSSVGVKGKDLFMPIRLKLTGVSHGIELINIVNILGKEEVINRLSK
jgi:nondiscriminating glutamyl-tRNA synthetase